MRPLALSVLAVALLAACDSGHDAASGVIGSYVAVRYVTPAPNDLPVDQLANGGHLALHLRADGSYVGDETRVHVLVGPPGPSSVATTELAHAGTYRVVGDRAVAFTSTSEASLPASTLDYDPKTNVLADSVFGRGPFVLVLEKRAD